MARPRNGSPYGHSGPTDRTTLSPARGGGDQLDESDRTALIVATIGAVGAAFSKLAELGDLSEKAALMALIAGATYYLAHKSRAPA